VHSTSNNGDSVSHTFTGSGIEALTELNSDEGNINVAEPKISGAPRSRTLPRRHERAETSVFPPGHCCLSRVRV